MTTLLSLQSSCITLHQPSVPRRNNPTCLHRRRQGKQNQQPIDAVTNTVFAIYIYGRRCLKNSLGILVWANNPLSWSHKLLFLFTICSLGLLGWPMTLWNMLYSIIHRQRQDLFPDEFIKINTENWHEGAHHWGSRVKRVLMNEDASCSTMTETQI